MSIFKTKYLLSVDASNISLQRKYIIRVRIQHITANIPIFNHLQELYLVISLCKNY